MPDTSFSCQQQPYPGYYADVETRCQIFHVCANNRTYDFICPNGTIFHQAYLVCVWWNQFDCDSAPSLFEVNFNTFDSSRQGNETSLGSTPLASSNDFQQFYQSPEQQLLLASDQGDYDKAYPSNQFDSTKNVGQKSEFSSGQTDSSRRQIQTNINPQGYSSQQPAPFSKKISSQETNFNDFRKYLPTHQNGY